MKILILGGSGMLGHQLLKHLSQNHDVKVSLRQAQEHYNKYDLFNQSNSYFEIDANNTQQLKQVFEKFQPQVVINAIGVIKQRDNAKQAIPSIRLNALLPHKVAQLCEQFRARMVHVSTDCVFDGRQGNYTEDDVASCQDLYGRTKLLGEVDYPHCITLRSSIIGLELENKHSLVEWMLSQSGIISGFSNAMYSGLTTKEMCRVIEMVLLQQPDLFGLWHVSSTTVSKYQLLSKLVDLLMPRNLVIKEDQSFVCDRSLNSEKFKRATGYIAPSWDDMLNELAQQIKQREA